MATAAKNERDADGGKPREGTQNLELRFGVRSMSTDTTGLRDTSAQAISFVGRFDLSVLLGARYLRGAMLAAFGAGPSGLEGEVDSVSTQGGRLRLGRDDGIYFRMGSKLSYLSSPRFTASLIQFPRAEAGYSYMTRDTVIDLGIQGGPSLIGRYNTAGFSRKLGGVIGYGVTSQLRHETFSLDAGFTRIRTESQSRSAPVDLFQILLCTMSNQVSICADGRAWNTPLLAPPGADRSSSSIRASFVGLWVGAGYFDSQTCESHASLCDRDPSW